jgi:hypothetical protein
MGWERRRGNRYYYYRCEWRGGRCIKRYIGRGRAAEIAAREDRQKQAARAARRYAAEIERALEKPASDSLVELDGVVTVAIHSALTAAGYHRHQRGKWRKKRHGKAGEATKQAINGK